MRGLLFLCFSVCASTCFAQALVVRDAIDLHPVEGAVIRTSNGSGSCLSDARGRCLLSGAGSSDTLVISHVSYAMRTLVAQEAWDAGGEVHLLPRAVPLAEFVVSANRFREPTQDLAERVDVVDARDIAFLDQPTTGDLLQNAGTVFVQKSQMGGGSPVIRGFEASRILLVVDGVRMNNAIYRAGHLQDIMTVDQQTVDRIEVISGPASVVYGSDALGGVIHMITRAAPFLDSAGTRIGGSALVRHATANKERTAHVDLSISRKRFSSFTSITASRFGDLRQGRVRQADQPRFGERAFYVERSDGVDRIVSNTDPDVQVGTAYDQLDLMEKLRWRTGASTTHQINLQLSASSDVPRYDRLSEATIGADGSIVPAHAEWYYGPQRRFLAAYGLEMGRSRWSDQARITPSFQHVVQSRHNRAWGSSRLGHRVEEVDVWGINAEFEKRLARHEVRYGLEAYHNTVSSHAERTDINTGAVSYLTTRYPNGGSSMSTAAAFVTHTFEAGKRWILSDGLRFNHVGLDATFADENDFQFLNGRLRQRHDAFNWRLATVYAPDTTWRLTALLNTGFRAPNVDDLAKVFDSTPGRVVVPNPALRPERTLNAEIGVNKVMGGRHSIQLTAFHTWFSDALVVQPFQQNGRDSLLYDEVMSQVTALTNAGKAFITGANATMTVTLRDRLSWSNAITYTYGRVVNGDDQAPLDHIPPLYGRSGLEWLLARAKVEAYVLYNGWKRVRDYSDSGEDNLHYATPAGMPAWITYNVRGSCTLSTWLSVQLAVENIADRNYRTFASGVSAPGRNVQVSARVTF